MSASGFLNGKTARGSQIATLAVTCALLVCVALGFFARFHELGARQLAVDEYYFLEAVGRILEQGLPAFPTGGYYTRGLPAQYLTAASILVFGDSGFAQRLPAALFGLASVALLFVYARPRLGGRLAAILAALLLVSSWEIEFSRFARMYAPFQCATLVFLLAYDRALLGDRWDRRYLAHAAAAVMVLTHTLGLLLTPLLLVPLVVAAGTPRFPTRAHAIRYALVSAATILACRAYTKVGFRRLGVIDPYPADFVPAANPLLRLPDFPFWCAGGDATTNLAVLIAVLGLSAVVAAAIAARCGCRDWIAGGLASLMLSSAALHSLLISGACGLLLLFRHEAWKSGPFSRRYRAVFAASALIAASWFAYALAARDWLSRSGGGTGSLLGALRRTFFGWPDFYTPILVPWAAALPGIGALTALAVLFQLWTNRKQPPAILARNPALLIVLVAVELGVLNSTFFSGMRFAYFIYPIALYTIALSILELSKRSLPRCAVRADLVAGGICLALFALSADFNLRHLIGVTKPDASFRMGVFAERGAIWYPRYDYASPTQFLQARAVTKPPMPIIIAGLPPVSDDLALDHAVFYPRGHPIFQNVSREQGTRDLWSQRQLLSTAEELRSYTSGAETFWLMRSVDTARQSFRIEDVWKDRLIDTNREFVGKDGRVEVVSVVLEPVVSRD